MNQNPYQAPQVVDQIGSQHDNLDKSPQELVIIARRVSRLVFLTVAQLAWFFMSALILIPLGDERIELWVSFVSTGSALVIAACVVRAALPMYSLPSAWILGFAAVTPCLGLPIVGVVFARAGRILRFNGIPVKGWRMPKPESILDFRQADHEPKNE